MNKKETMWLVVAIIVAYSLAMFNFYEGIAAMILNSSALLALVLYFLFNPAYLIIILGITSRFKQKKSWKRVIASVSTVVALDMLAFPRLGVSDSLLDGPAVTGNIGSIIMRGLETFTSHNVAYLLMYFFIPVVLLLMAMELLGVIDFIKEVNI